MEKFCRYCGTAFTVEPEKYPKHCGHCRQMTWKNPTPVAVLVQPIVDGDRWGVVVGERGIEPFKGGWNLIGGYVDCEDTDMVSAACREWREETGIDLSTYRQNTSMSLMSSYCDHRVILTFVESSIPIGIGDLDKFVPNYECPRIRVAWEPEQLCFVSHTQALALWFEKHNAYR